MAKSTEIINHLEGLDEASIEKVGASGQIQLIKKEDEISDDINEFYDTVEEAETEAETWEQEE